MTTQEMQEIMVFLTHEDRGEETCEQARRYIELRDKLHSVFPTDALCRSPRQNRNQPVKTGLIPIYDQ